MARDRFHAGLECRIACVVVLRAQILVFDKAGIDARSGARRRTSGAGGQARGNRGEVECVQRVHALMPVRGALTARQVELHNVEELAIAGIDLHLPVMEDVIGAA